MVTIKSNASIWMCVCIVCMRPVCPNAFYNIHTPRYDTMHLCCRLDIDNKIANEHNIQFADVTLTAPTHSTHWQCSGIFLMHACIQFASSFVRSFVHSKCLIRLLESFSFRVFFSPLLLLFLFALNEMYNIDDGWLALRIIMR